MSVHDLNKEQFEELRQRLEMCYDYDDFEAVGAQLECLSDGEIMELSAGCVTDEIVKKCFGIYDFVDDDFFAA